MSNWNATKRLPRLIQPPRYARNGQLVTSAYYSKIAEVVNHISAHRRKLVGSYSQNLASPVAAASGTNTTWRSYFRTGHGVEKLAVRLLMGSNSSATAPAVTIALINPSTGATIDSFTRYVGDTDIAHVPGEWVDASGYLAVSDDTAYGIDWNVTDYARLYSGTAYEIGTTPVSDATTGSVDPRYSVGGPILDAQPLAMAQGLTELLKSNRRHLIAWSAYGASTITNNTATYKNILDGTSTAVSAATPGWYLQNAYCNTLSRTGVPCVFAVYAGATLNGGYMKITDGTNELETAVITTAGWYTVAGLLPAAAATKYDVWQRGHASGGLITPYACALLEYE